MTITIAMELEDQYAVIRELELPVACLVHSGKKSLHAIVRVDADTYEEYRKRVDYLYDVCQKNGLAVDKQNRNPSRLIRMPKDRGRREKAMLLQEFQKRSFDVRHMEKTAALWKEIEAAANRYGTEPTIENADAFFRAVYGTDRKKEEQT